MSTILDLIHNLALLIALSVLASLPKRQQMPRAGSALIQGALLGSVAVAGMLNAMTLGPGLQFDGRSVAISLCGLYFGPLAATVAALMAAVCRILQGGTGAPMGVLAIILAAGIGAVFHTRLRREPGALTHLQLWGFGMLVHVTVLSTTLLLPLHEALDIMVRIAIPMLGAFPLATVLVGGILSHRDRQLRYVTQVRESEAQFRATLYSIGDGVITTDRTGKVLQMNPVAEALTGWREEEARGRALEEVFVIVDEVTREPAGNPAVRALAEGRIVGLANHTVLISRDGHEFPIADSGAPIRGLEDGLAGAVLVFRDQRAEREAELALREGRERFERAVEHIPDVVVIYGSDLRIQYINEATRLVTGMPASHFIGKRDDEVWSSEVYENYLPQLKAALETGEVQSVDVVLSLPGTGERHLSIRCVPMFSSIGSVREILAITHDYTDQFESAQAVMESENRFRSVFNQQFQLMAILSLEGVLLEVNELPLRIGGVTRDEVVGKLFWETVWWRDLETMRRNWPRRLEAARMSNAPVFSIDEFQDAAGAIRVADASVMVMRSDTGEPLYFIVQATDITAQQHAREELIATNNLLERTLDSMSEAVLVINYDTRSIVRSNAAVERIFGYRQAELDGACTRLIHVDDVHFEKFGKDSAAALSQGRAFYTEFPMRRKDGAIIQTEITVQTINVLRGWKTGVVSVIRDITERKEAEDALRKSEGLLRIAGEAARIGGWYVDLPGGVVTWSAEARAIHEAPEGVSLDAQEAVLTYAPGSRERVDMAFANCAEAGIPYDLELEMITHSGRRSWVRAIGKPVRDINGRIVRVQGALQDINEQKQIEYTLARSQQQFQQLADAMPLIVWTAEPDGQVDFANRALENYAGVTGAGGAGELLWEAVHPDDRSRYAAVWRNSLMSAERHSIELRLRRRDGVCRWHQIHGVPVMDEKGLVLKWYGTASDVQDSKLNEERLARTMESITDAFYTLDRDWRFTYVNQEAERLLRHGRDELLGKVAVHVFPEMMKGEVSRNYLRAVRHNTSVEFVTFYAPFNQWFEVHAYPSEEGLAVYFRDITEKRAAEQELRALSARLQGILDFSPLLITEVDLEGRYLLANKATCDFLGAAPGAIIGKKIEDILASDAAALFASRVREVAGRSRPAVVEDQFETDGEMRSFSTMLFPLFNGEGAVVSVGGIAQEVTDRKRAEADRARLEEQLRQAQKMDAIGRLAGGVAHDFNNMLGVILGFTEMALEVLPEEHAAAQDLAQVRVAATHSAELTRQLLAFARKQTIAPEVLDLNATVASILKMLGRLIGEDIELVWRPGEHLPPVRLDPTQIDQILANLAVNARDAIQGVGKLTIETSHTELDATYCEQHPGCSPGHYVVLSIHDDGCGMTREIQAQIFEPFFTTKPLGSGTGLGLSTVYGIVKQNSGFIDVYSEVGRGTVFRIYLPSFSLVSEAPRDVMKGAAPRGGTETVLLVEDEAGLLELGRRLLERLGYVVLAANGPTEALSMAVDFPGHIDLLITDVIMPEMNGRELWMRLKELRPTMKSLFMSGYTADVIATQGSLEPGVNFLQKPFTMDSFSSKIRDVLSE